MLHPVADQLHDIWGAGSRTALPVLDGAQGDASQALAELRLCKTSSVAEGSDCG